MMTDSEFAISVALTATAFVLLRLLALYQLKREERFEEERKRILGRIIKKYD